MILQAAVLAPIEFQALTIPTWLSVPTFVLTKYFLRQMNWEFDSPRVNDLVVWEKPSFEGSAISSALTAENLPLANSLNHVERFACS